MKNVIKVGIIVVLTAIVSTACDKEDNFSSNSIEGTYVGTLTSEGIPKSVTLLTGGGHDATAEIKHMDEGLIEIHCYSNELDTTFMLNYYEHNDSILVCLNGDDFENMYGHMMGQGHMSGGMMGDMSIGETEWMHHIDDEHMESDEHFGGFDMDKETFTYLFRMMDGSTLYHMRFHGTKN